MLPLASLWSLLVTKNPRVHVQTKLDPMSNLRKPRRAGSIAELTHRIMQEKEKKAEEEKQRQERQKKEEMVRAEAEQKKKEAEEREKALKEEEAAKLEAQRAKEMEEMQVSQPFSPPFR